MVASQCRRKELSTDFFDRLTDPEAIERVGVTDVLDTETDAWAPAATGRGEDEALAGTLVHRLFQFADATSDPVDLANRLMRPEERATAADARATVNRAIEVWTAIKEQPDVRDVLQSGERIHELPFSTVEADRPMRVLRGTIDCLIRQPDGSIVVLEFKTGRPSPAHRTQLDVYMKAAKTLFPGSRVTGRILYPR